MSFAAIVAHVIMGATAVSVCGGLISYAAFRARQRRRRSGAGWRQVSQPLEYFGEYVPAPCSSNECPPATGSPAPECGHERPSVRTQFTFWLLLATVASLGIVIVYFEFVAV